MSTLDQALSRSQPLYQQIESRLAALILSGELQPGDKLPTNKGLAARFGVTVQTAHNAAALLWRRWASRRKRGRSTSRPRRDLLGRLRHQPRRACLLVEKATGLVNDVPGESMGNPNLWGTACLAP
jgi:DNA-binding transcriptional MocR family regulator